MMMEPSDPIFQLFHRYNKLVRRELVKPLNCKTCDSTLVTGVSDKDELLLKCYTCDSSIVPGLTLLSQVNAVVKEHFIDD